MGTRSETILFDALIPAGTHMMTLERGLVFPGRVREMSIQFYPGQQKALQVTPYMLKAPDIMVPLSKYTGGRSYFSGDDAQYNMAMSLRFGTDDRLCVDVSNVSDYDYDLYVIFEVEYETQSGPVRGRA